MNDKMELELHAFHVTKTGYWIFRLNDGSLVLPFTEKVTVESLNKDMIADDISDFDLFLDEAYRSDAVITDTDVHFSNCLIIPVKKHAVG